MAIHAKARGISLGRGPRKKLRIEREDHPFQLDGMGRCKKEIKRSESLFGIRKDKGRQVEPSFPLF